MAKEVTVTESNNIEKILRVVMEMSGVKINRTAFFEEGVIEVFR